MNEDQFGLGVQLLPQFVSREGHANVPLDHREDGIHLGTWVDNMKFEQANNGLRKDWGEQLEAVPGWKRLAHEVGRLSADWVRRLVAIPGWEG